ncbi:MAG: ribosomal L7Ae/L30e/S12e/Gadd45 family protein [Nitrososphaerota archaeon]|nr:ribosomal L7Ae/L30e/S12e/Gadd45 family protein [Candidatus Calditenuaceae archaeon]MDW8073709.1 ribosomal L7Ae/L30e/S12e/Gadd45 family protein [Nitrososphaerota archaeon]
MDVRKELSVIRITGKYLLGFRQSYLSIVRKSAKAVVLANNCPENQRSMLELAAKTTQIPLIYSDLTARELGQALGKPFGSSTVAIIDPGNSSILGEAS